MRAARKPSAQPLTQWMETAAKPTEPPDRLEKLQAYDNEQLAAVGIVRALELEELDEESD
jgi:hypothetical protein